MDQHTPEDVAAYRRIAAGDIGERNRMAERHLGLVASVASHYAKRNPTMDMDDLIQEGRYGLVYALNKFDVDKGYRFSTYAMWWIRRFVQRYVASNHSVGMSSSRTDTELYMSMRMEGENKELYEQRCLSMMSLSWEADGEDQLYAFVEDPSLSDFETSAIESIDIGTMKSVLNSDLISEEQRQVISMRYGVLGESQHTVAHTARRMGINKQQVSELERSTINLLLDLMEAQ